MNDKEYLRYLHIKAEVERHLSTLKEAFSWIEQKTGLPLNEQKVNSLLKTTEGTMVLDQIAYRFSKLQDSLGKLLRVYLFLKGENAYHLPIGDVVLLMEKYGFNISLEKWFALRSIRNALAHEYEEEREKIASVINRVREELPFFEKLLNQLTL
ncbi:hypothetical protein SAMN06265339_0454 [Desulfurobacterium pacificum]|uniref:DUF86 domain-containing protein n=1 Tax=Desulfurobacterium pacificum TaxID=240166 RepID=A0ABY1NEM5_9BACT|nr:hypothetical protein [Desulfurobacterium pacificum]SMP07202.1 hypothetical protein SAMN06265339_0454 [Desulfurobacterium pacificum]